MLLSAATQLSTLNQLLWVLNCQSVSQQTEGCIPSFRRSLILSYT